MSRRRKYHSEHLPLGAVMLIIFFVIPMVCITLTWIVERTVKFFVHHL